MTTMAASTARPGAAASLAPELLYIILAPLSQPEVLAAAAVNSRWRACAVQHPMYYRAWTFLLPYATPSAHSYAAAYETVKQLEQVVGEAEAGRNNLALSLSVRLDPDRASGSSPAPSSLGLDTPAPVLGQSVLSEAQIESHKATLRAELAPILRRVLARCIALSVSCDISAAEILWTGLSVPAPLLRRLKISIVPTDMFLHSLPELEPIPAQFLARTAPRMTYVLLHLIGITASSPCFPSVETLLLYYPLDLHAAHAAFPGTKHLTIERLALGMQIPDADRSIFGQLESLRLGPNKVAVGELVPALTHIPLIECHGNWRNAAVGVIPSSGETSLRVYEHVRRSGVALVLEASPRFGQLCLEFRAGGLTRLVDCDVPFKEACAFGDLRRALPWITEMTIDDRHVRTLFATWARFPALKGLRITLVSWASAPEEDATDLGDRYDGSCPDGDVRMDLPALQTLELRATWPRAVLPLNILRALSRSFGGEHLHLALSNGLSLAEHCEAVPLFASVTSSDASFCATLPCVVRAAALLAAAESRRKAVLQDTDRALRT